MFLAAVLVVGLFTGEGDYCLQIFFKAANDCERSSCALKVFSATLKMRENLTVYRIEQFLSYRSCFVWYFWWIRFRSSFVCGLRGGDCSFCARSANLKAPVPCARSTGGQIQDLPQVFRRQCFSTSS